MCSNPGKGWNVRHIQRNLSGLPFFCSRRRLGRLLFRRCGRTFAAILQAGLQRIHQVNDVTARRRRPLGDRHSVLLLFQQVL
jgi:hypothetical protein